MSEILSATTDSFNIQTLSTNINDPSTSVNKKWTYDYDTIDFAVTNQDFVYIDNIDQVVAFSICIYENCFPSVANYKNMTITTNAQTVLGTNGTVNYKCSSINNTYQVAPKGYSLRSFDCKTRDYQGVEYYHYYLSGYGKSFTNIKVELIIDDKAVASGVKTYNEPISIGAKIYYKVTGTYKKRVYTGKELTTYETPVTGEKYVYKGAWQATDTVLSTEYTTTEVPVDAYTVVGLVNFSN